MLTLIPYKKEFKILQNKRFSKLYMIIEKRLLKYIEKRKEKEKKLQLCVG